jgi:hypothetical protein
VNSIHETKNEERRVAKVNEILGINKGNETKVNAITNTTEEVDFIARNPYMPSWKIQN